MLIMIKGAGDLASGVALRCYRSGFPVVMTEIARPTVVRRTVAFAEAVYEKEVSIEGVRARLAHNSLEARELLAKRVIPVLIDPEAEETRRELGPQVIVDAILAKKNLGTFRGQAPLVIGLGPGFIAGKDVDVVIETKRGHYLGRVIHQGQAIANTGIPGEIQGYGKERVLRAPVKGSFQALRRIGDPVEAGEAVACVGKEPVRTVIGGVLRGLLRDGLEVERGMKIGDVDPRARVEYCFSISEKALAIGGGVLEAILHHEDMVGRKSEGEENE
ncbi:MAG TPA: EF2563 family selenium-dependent molybdenum hydroxylase system protein [Clostridia bacterium]|nr:EF2563 family selenium-dependent molybdenum hydroxylase system protein [Clostridia bacterium]